MNTFTRVSLSKITINKGGYDSRGKYYGVGLPIYSYHTYIEPQDYSGEFRAVDRKHARQITLKILTQMFPDVKFSFYN